MKNDGFKELCIYIYKIGVFSVNYLVFAWFFSMVNPEMMRIGRISILTLFVYIITLVLLLPIYRSFDIGQRKSIPVIFSTSVVYLLSLLTIYFIQVIMSVRLELFSLVLTKGMLLLIPIYLVQFVLLYLFSFWGNELYFKLYEPHRTLVLYEDPEHLSKILDYVTSHDKQYNLLDVIENDSTYKIAFNEYSTIFLVGVRSKTRYKIQEKCFMESVDLYYTSSVADVISGKTKSTVIDDVLMIESAAVKFTLIQSIMKRSMDIIFSLIGLIPTLPVFLIVAIAIKLDDGGNVFYTQERLTINGRAFNIIKFRSMKVNSGNRPATSDDDRITKVGKIIRKLRIDELPQIFNILKGEMSIVGPRPESTFLVEEIEKDVPNFAYRLKVKAGLTGYAQIFGKYNTTSNQKLILDLKYIVNYSVANDIKLIFQTVNVFFNPSNSTQGFQEQI